MDQFLGSRHLASSHRASGYRHQPWPRDITTEACHGTALSEAHSVAMLLQLQPQATSSIPWPKWTGLEEFFGLRAPTLDRPSRAISWRVSASQLGSSQENCYEVLTRNVMMYSWISLLVKKGSKHLIPYHYHYWHTILSVLLGFAVLILVIIKYTDASFSAPWNKGPHLLSASRKMEVRSSKLFSTCASASRRACQMEFSHPTEKRELQSVDLTLLWKKKKKTIYIYIRILYYVIPDSIICTMG